MCSSGKICYESKKAAQTVLNYMKTHTHTDKKLRIYPCKYCQGWHLTKLQNGMSHKPKDIDLFLKKEFEQLLIKE